MDDVICMELSTGDTISVPRRIGKYELHHQIGIGSTAVVALATNVKTQFKYAIKVVSRTFLIEQGLLLRFEQEIRIMKTFDHPHIVKTEEILFDKNYIYVVMEYCFNGDLFDYIMTSSPIPETECLKIFEQTLEALSYLHHKKVAHRDIKPENILLDLSMNIKLCDFGLCHTIDSNLLKTACGSPIYSSPEIIGNKDYDGTKSDIWSLGIVFYIMVTGRLPWNFQTNKQLFLQIDTGQVPYPENLSPVYRNILQCMLQKDPNMRLSADELLKITPKRRPGVHRLSADLLKAQQRREDIRKLVSVNSRRVIRPLVVRINGKSLAAKKRNCFSDDYTHVFTYK